jgi:hypothetical protein
MLLVVGFVIWLALRRAVCSVGKYQVKGLARMNNTDRQLQSIAVVTMDYSLSTTQPTTLPLQNVGNSILMHSLILPKLALCPWMGSKLQEPSPGVEDSMLSTVP